MKKMLKVEIPTNLFAVLDEVLFKVLVFLYAVGVCKKDTKEDEIREDDDCFTEIEVDYLARLLNLDVETTVNALARLIEEGFVIIRETEETEEIPYLISYWCDYSTIEHYEGYKEEDVLYTNDLKISLYEEETANVTDYLMNFQDLEE